MTRSNQSIRSFTRNQLSGNYGQAIVATIVPSLFVWFANMILSSITAESYVFSLVATALLSVITTFTITKMSLNIAKGSKSAGLDECLSPKERLLKVLYYVIIIQVVSFLITLPINQVFLGSYIVDDAAINNFVAGFQGDTGELLTFLYGYLGTMFAVALLVLFITYKIMYIPYIIIDQGLSLGEAFSKSLEYTKGNFFRIMGMYFFFIGWYFLSVLTCGILLFYVIPYQTISSTQLYLTIKAENGDAEESDVFEEAEEDEYKDPFETERYNGL